jgi:hypothetical protein
VDLQGGFFGTIRCPYARQTKIKYLLAAIKEPPPGTRAIMTSDIGRAFFFTGSELAPNLLCGKCERILVSGSRRERLGQCDPEVPTVRHLQRYLATAYLRGEGPSRSQRRQERRLAVVLKHLRLVPSKSWQTGLPHLDKSH